MLPESRRNSHGRHTQVAKHSSNRRPQHGTSIGFDLALYPRFDISDVARHDDRGELSGHRATTRAHFSGNTFSEGYHLNLRFFEKSANDLCVCVALLSEVGSVMFS